MVVALFCVRPQFYWYQLAYATERKSIQLHDSIEGLSQLLLLLSPVLLPQRNESSGMSCAVVQASHNIGIHSDLNQGPPGTQSSVVTTVLITTTVHTFTLVVIHISVDN